jgi:cytochrome c5
MMSKGKMAFSILFAGLLLMALVIACGGGEEPTQAPPAPPSPRGAEVTPVETPSPTPPRPEITPTEVQSPTPQPTLTGQELVQERCTICHGLERLDHPHTTAQWEGVVELMRSYGAELTDQEAQTLVEYLVENYGR